MRKYYNYESLTNVPYCLCLEPYGSLEYEWTGYYGGNLVRSSFLLRFDVMTLLSESSMRKEPIRVGSFWWTKKDIEGINMKLVFEQPIWYK